MLVLTRMGLAKEGSQSSEKRKNIGKNKEKSAGLLCNIHPFIW